MLLLLLLLLRNKRACLGGVQPFTEATTVGADSLLTIKRRLRNTRIVMTDLAAAFSRIHGTMSARPAGETWWDPVGCLGVLYSAVLSCWTIRMSPYGPYGFPCGVSVRPALISLLCRLAASASHSAAPRLDTKRKEAVLFVRPLPPHHSRRNPTESRLGQRL